LGKFWFLFNFFSCFKVEICTLPEKSVYFFMSFDVCNARARLGF